MLISYRLIFIKIIHTFIWFLFNVVLFYMLYAVVSGRIDKLVWIGIALILLEGLLLLVFRNMCPLTVMARRYSTSEKANFDIYLPNWLARHNKVIYTTIFAIIICILMYRLAE